MLSTARSTPAKQRTMPRARYHRTDAAVEGATVTTLNTATGAKQTTKTDARGAYSFPVLAVGQYELALTADGFRPYRRTGLVIDVNSALIVDGVERITPSAESRQVSVAVCGTTEVVPFPITIRTLERREKMP